MLLNLHLPRPLKHNGVTLLVLFIALTGAFAAETDSLAQKLKQAKNPVEFYDVHVQIAKSLWSNNHDSAYFHLESAQEWVLKTNDADRIFSIMTLRGNYYNENGQYSKAIDVFISMLDHSLINANPSMLARTYSNIGNSYTLLNSKVKAINSYKKAIEYIEKGDDLNEKASLYGRLGNLYYMNGGYQDAIGYYKKANILFSQLKKEQGVALTYMNTGNCYKQLAEADSAITYYTSALNKFRQIGNLPYNEAQCLANLGNINLEHKRYSVARRYLLSADSLFAKIENPYSVSLINRDLASLYLDINRLDLAITRIDKCLNIAVENKYDYLIMSAYKLLWTYYEKLNDIELAYSWFKKYNVIKDSLDFAEKEANFDLLLAEFETERKEKEIELLKQTGEINQLKIRRRTLNLYISLLGFVIAIFFVVFLYASNQKRKRTNQLLSDRNAEINQQKEEITSQRDEIESQRDMLQSQNNMLEQFRTHTNHSLRYAQSIQAAILPSEKILEQISSEYFVLMKPCELVSGDFFWASSFDDYQVFCVADCTGHGVPGAFMSILGITALNNIVSRHRISAPSKILGYLRESVIEALSQNDPDQLHKDGMDIALCSWNKKTRELQFAGAGLPLWIVSEESSPIETDCVSSNTPLNGFSLCEVKGDIMPVGTSPRMGPFTNRIITLPKGNIRLYLVTDGFADQPGGERKSKFGALELKKNILRIADKEMATQSEILSKTFNRWKGENYQVDDVTILGIKI